MNLSGSWSEYAQQYERAAHRLIAASQDGDIVIYPALFLYRHFLELQLKAIFGLGIVVEHVEEEKIEAQARATRMLNTHDLVSLTTGCRAVCDRIGLLQNTPFVQAFTTFTECINELSQLDPESFGFRYPVDKRFQNALRKPFSIDLEHLGTMMTKLSTLLRLVWLAVNHRTNEISYDTDADWDEADGALYRRELLGIDELEADEEINEE